MIIPSEVECEHICLYGEYLDSGASRDVFTHEDYPGIVVKVVREGEDMWGNQNDREVQNYKWLMNQRLPSFIKVPKTVKVGQYVVQEFVEGKHPPEHGYDEWGNEIPCECFDSLGLPYCWEVETSQYNGDAHSGNVMLVGKTVYMIDLGV